jgi:hypothetical protein
VDENMKENTGVKEALVRNITRIGASIALDVSAVRISRTFMASVPLKFS